MTNLNKQKASALIFIIIITLVITLSIIDFSTVVVQLQKINNIENQQIKLNKNQNSLLSGVYEKLLSYKKLDEIPDVFQQVRTEGVSEVSFINQSSFTTIHSVYKYKIYRIDLLLDEQYASKLHIYLAMCEDMKTQPDLKIIPISQLLS